MMSRSRTVTRAQRNEFVLRLAVKAGVCGHLAMSFLWPLIAEDQTSKAWPVAMLFGRWPVGVTVSIIFVLVLAGQWLKTLRMIGGIAYMAFCFTYSWLILSVDPRIAAFSFCMGWFGFALALTGVPDHD